MTMFTKLFRRGAKDREIDPDEIFLDSANLSDFDLPSFEGRMEKPIGPGVAQAIGAFFLMVLVVFAARVFYLNIWRGLEYRERSEQNHLRYSPVFAERGAILDRHGVELASNAAGTSSEFSLRRYTAKPGLAHILGFVKYPSKDANGFYYAAETLGLDGAEKAYDEELGGQDGVRIIEVDATGAIASKSVITPPEPGRSVTLSIDSRVQQKLFELIRKTANDVGFTAGAGALLDVTTGELIALASFPDYAPQIMTDGADTEAIERYVSDPRKPFLNRAISGLYTPGSIVKPFMAAAALNERLITPEKEIVSTGSIAIQNPYDPRKKSIFNDWKAHGAVDMRKALAVSSNVYFYEIGGGFENQPGLGIGRIESYLRRFGFGEPITDPFLGGEAGTIPTPAWKAEHFNGEPWRVGDTYNTAIGQYGLLVTPLQAVRALAGLANGFTLPQPTILKDERRQQSGTDFGIDRTLLKVVWEGMREAVLTGTAKGLYLRDLSVAAKTGTAEIGTSKNFVNSWVIGFYPYENPRYAFAVIMEKGPRDNLIGAAFVSRAFLEWLVSNAPEYAK